MKVIIHESQFNRMINNSHRWGLIGINEGRNPRFSPEEEDKEIERIINKVKETGEFSFNQSNLDYVWMYSGSNRKIGWEKFEKALKDIREIIGKKEKIPSDKEDEEIERIINKVRQTGEFRFDAGSNPDYSWLYRGSNRKIGGEKFEKALSDIREIIGKNERIPSDKEDEEIERIINKVKETGEFSFKNEYPDFAWLRRRKNREIGGEKFEKAIKDIKEILGKKEDEKIKRIINKVRQTGEFSSVNKNLDYVWLRRGKNREIGGEKFEKALKDIKKILIVLGVKREWWGERTIKQILIGMGFTDIPDDSGKYIIDDCKNSLTCKHYKFDVHLPYNETNHMINKNIPETGIIFEYDGEQHFKSIPYFGGDKKLEETIHSDREKNSYCQNHKPNPIKLVRIPYTSKTRDDIKRDIESALDNPSNFILTGDYPKAGWNK